MNQLQKELLGIEIENYIMEKTDLIIEEIFRLFPEIDDVEVGMDIQLFECESVTT